MRKSFHILAASTAMCVTALVTALPASATCTRLAFSVNDYGKDGPTKDAKRLLDKYVSKWATDHSIKKYTTGNKSVSCELFLNFILFDEHTCKAEASVCWDGPAVAGMPGAKPETAAVTPSGPAKSKATTTGSIEKTTEKPTADKATDTPKTEEAKAPKADKAAKSDADSKDSKKESYAKVPDDSGKAAKSDAATTTDGAKKDAPVKKLVKSAAKPKVAAKVVEPPKPKAPLPEKPESAPVQ